MQDLKEIAKDSGFSFEYAKSLSFKNVPEIILKSIAKHSGYCCFYAEHLKFKNVPLIILKSTIKYYYSFFTYGIEYFPVNKHLLCYILHFDKRIIK